VKKEEAAMFVHILKMTLPSGDAFMEGDRAYGRGQGFSRPVPNHQLSPTIKVRSGFAPGEGKTPRSHSGHFQINQI